MKNLINSSVKTNAILLAIALGSLILMSPKWFLTIAAWVYFTAMIRFLRNQEWKAFILAWIGSVIAGCIAQSGVFPMPLAQVGILMTVASLFGLAPFLIDRIFNKKFQPWITTLIFPVTNTLLSYLMDQGPQGTWINFAYTQFHFSSFMQLASITGIYGIVFMISWFASLVNFVLENWQSPKRFKPMLYTFSVIFIGILVYGKSRLSTEGMKHPEVQIATITLDNMEIMTTMYEDAFGETIQIPEEISMTSPELIELQKGQLAFMKEPESLKFSKSINEIDNILEDYLEASRKTVEEGAKIIAWSEGAIVNIKSREDIHFKKAQDFARENQVYLFFPTAVFHPEKVGKEAKFIENKILTFAPDGSLLNTYFKNIPIFGVEPSFAGDGNIPVIETPFGNLSPAICYDLDFPNLIAQTSTNNADALVVPTGDWKGIDPYHTYMGATRCIENGISMIKPVANGLSAIIDDKGRLVESLDFFNEKKIKSINTRFSVNSSDTLFASFAPKFIIANVLLFFAGLFYLIIQLVKNKWLRHSMKPSV